MTRFNQNTQNPLPDVGYRFARILLILSLVFLPILALNDFQHGYVYPAIAKCIVILICAIGYYLCKQQQNQKLVRYSVASALLIMATVGAVYKLDGYNGQIWVPVLPLLFSFLVGVKSGSIFSAIYLLVYSISYFSFEKIHGVTPIEIEFWSMAVVAFIFVLVVTALFQKEIQKDKKHLSDVAKFDFLTQLLNRRGFVPRIEEEVARVGRYSGDLSIIVADIDNFKLVNDNFGHGVGDKLLAEFARILLTYTRSSDLVARWGGEEFVILAPNTEMCACLDLAEKLKSVIEQHSFTDVGHITSSFGVTQYKQSEGWSEFFDRADTNLLKAKHAGKNRVIGCVKPGVVSGQSRQNSKPAAVA